MAQRKPKLTAGSNGSAKGDERFPKEAYDYADDVTEEAVQKLRESVGIDFSNEVWKTIDGFGRVIHA